MDSIFTYHGRNVDDLTHIEAIEALKLCIHELEQERRNKHTVNLTYPAQNGVRPAEVSTYEIPSQNCLHQWEGARGAQLGNIRNCKLCGKSEYVTKGSTGAGGQSTKTSNT